VIRCLLFVDGIQELNITAILRVDKPQRPVGVNGIDPGSTAVDPYSRNATPVGGSV
jgi:hypothetical protein